MKSFRTTLIFAVVVIAVAVFAFMEFKKVEEEKQAELTKDRILQLGDAKVVEVKVERTDDEIHLKQNENGAWQLVEPIQDQASESAVSNLLSTITGRDGRPVEVEGQVNWQEYGLEDPAAKISLTTKSGASHQLQVSRTEAFDGSYFIRKGNELLISDERWREIVQKPVDALRDKSILSKVSDPKEIFIQYPRQHREIHLQRTETGWEVPKQDQLKISGSQVEEFLGQMSRLEATGFMAESKGEEDLKEYGLHRPEMTVRLVFSEDHESFFEVSPVEDQEAYAITSERDTIFKLAKADVEEVEWGLEDFRDKQAPFRLDVEMVGQLLVKSKESQLVVEKDGSQWSLAGGSSDKKLNEEELQSLFTSFKSLEAFEFLDGAKGKGLSQPERQLVFKGNDGNTLLQIDIGKDYEVEKDGKTTLLYYVRSSASTDDLGVKVTAINALPWSELVEESGAKKSEKSAVKASPEASAN